MTWNLAEQAAKTTARTDSKLPSARESTIAYWPMVGREIGSAPCPAGRKKESSCKSINKVLDRLRLRWILGSGDAA